MKKLTRLDEWKKEFSKRVNYITIDGIEVTNLHHWQGDICVERYLFKPNENTTILAEIKPSHLVGWLCVQVWNYTPGAHQYDDSTIRHDLNPTYKHGDGDPALNYDWATLDPTPENVTRLLKEIVKRSREREVKQ